MALVCGANSDEVVDDIGEQNGLEAWRLLVRSEQPVTGANRIAAMQAILQYKFSPGFDRLEEELRTFEGLVNENRRDYKSHVKLVQDEDSVHWIECCFEWAGAHGDWLGKQERQGQGQRQGKRRRAGAKRKARGRSRVRSRARSSKGGVTTAESEVTSVPIVGMEKRNRCTKCKVELLRSDQAVRWRQCRQIT